MFIILTCFYYVTITLFTCSMEFRFLMTLELRYIFDMFELRMEITVQLCFVFARHCYVYLLHNNYVIYLFDVVTFFDNVWITLYFGTFELRLEITLQLRYVFARHWDVILLRHNDVVLLRHNYVIYLFDVVTFFDDIRITLYSSTFKLRTKITLWNGHFLVTFVCNQKMTKTYVIIT